MATAAYIGAQLGRGPRDGLMTGLARRTGHSLRLVRTVMELTVVVIGLLLGGVAGLGTILYAVAIGPLSQALLPPRSWCPSTTGPTFQTDRSGLRHLTGCRFGPVGDALGEKGQPCRRSTQDAAAGKKRDYALQRHIGLVGLIWASVGSIIGSGWLFGAQEALAVAGPVGDDLAG